MVLSLPVDLSNPQIRDVTVLGRVARRDDGVVDGSGPDDTRHIHQMASRTKTTVADGQGYVLHGLLFLLMPTRDFISLI